MSKVDVDLPQTLLVEAQKLAERDGVTVNHLLSIALAEKIIELSAVEYLGERAARGDRRAFEEALSRVPDIEPPDYDSL